MVRVFESNGPDVKIRGNPSHIAEKYIQLARDAQTSGDPIAAENYYQHAEHYYRVIAVGAGAVSAEQSALPSQRERDAGSARRAASTTGDDDGQPSMGGSSRFTLRHARAAALYPARCTTLSAAATAPASASPRAARQRADRRRRRPVAVLHHRRATAQPHQPTGPAPGPERPRQPARPFPAASPAPTTSRPAPGHSGRR